MNRIPFAFATIVASLQGAGAQEQANHDQMSHEQMQQKPRAVASGQSEPQQGAKVPATTPADPGRMEMPASHKDMGGAAHDMGAMNQSGAAMDSMKDMKMGSHGEMSGMFGPYPMTREASGTSWQPDATPMEGGME